MDILSLDIDSKYKKWFKNLYSGGELHPSFIFMCNKHKRLIDKIPIEYRDIYNFKNVDHFISYMGSLESETEIEESIKNNGSTLIYENDDFMVKRILTLDAMRLYGKGSKWCIASDDSDIWSNYTKKDNIFFIVFSKKLLYTSQFSKFVVQLTNERDIIIWDRADNSYRSNMLDLINLSSDVFFNHCDLEISSKLVSQIAVVNEEVDESIYNILISNNAIIAGGALSSIVLNTTINDFDIWFSNQNDYNKAIFDMGELFKITRTRTDGSFLNHRGGINRYTTLNAITFSTRSRKFQFIDPSKYIFGNVSTIISQFDFTCVMCGIDLKNKKLVYGDTFFNDVKGKRLVVNKSLKSPASLLDRVVKYTKKGFRLPKETQKDILRLLTKVTEEEINDVTLTMY